LKPAGLPYNAIITNQIKPNKTPLPHFGMILHDFDSIMYHLVTQQSHNKIKW